MNLNVQNPARVTLSCVPLPLGTRGCTAPPALASNPLAQVSNFPSLRFSMIRGPNATYIRPFLCSY